MEGVHILEEDPTKQMADRNLARLILLTRMHTLQQRGGNRNLKGGKVRQQINFTLIKHNSTLETSHKCPS